MESFESFHSDISFKSYEVSKFAVTRKIVMEKFSITKSQTFSPHNFWMVYRNGMIQTFPFTKNSKELRKKMIFVNCPNCPNLKKDVFWVVTFEWYIRMV
jgi:hypothetical protein